MLYIFIQLDLMKLFLNNICRCMYGLYENWNLILVDTEYMMYPHTYIHMWWMYICIYLWITQYIHLYLHRLYDILYTYKYIGTWYMIFIAIYDVYISINQSITYQNSILYSYLYMYVYTYIYASSPPCVKMWPGLCCVTLFIQFFFFP